MLRSSAWPASFGTTWRTVWRTVKPLLDQLAADPARFDGVTTLGVDEHIWHHVNERDRGPRALTGMVDLTRDQAGRTRARLLDLVAGRSGKAYGDWLKDRGDPFRKRVKVATLDPFHGYKNAIDDQLADAVSVLDAFHVVKLGSQAVDDVRRRVQQAIHAHRGRKDDPLYGIRNLLRCAEERLTDRQHERLTKAIDADERHVEVLIAWRCAQQLRAVYHQPDPAVGRRLAEQVLTSFTTCPIPEVARLGRTLKRWRTPFLAYFDTAGANNGGTEAVIIWSPNKLGVDVADAPVGLCGRHVLWSLSLTSPMSHRSSGQPWRDSKLCRSGHDPRRATQPDPTSQAPVTRQRHVADDMPIPYSLGLQITVNGLIELHRRIARGFRNRDNYRLL